MDNFISHARGDSGADNGILGVSDASEGPNDGSPIQYASASHESNLRHTSNEALQRADPTRKNPVGQQPIGMQQPTEMQQPMMDQSGVQQEGETPLKAFTIDTPWGTSFQIDAPEDSTQEDILLFADSQGLLTEPGSQPELREGQSATNPDVDFIPTEENLAIPAPGLPERSFADQAIGAGEAALTMATGATGGLVGGLVGAVEGIGRELAGDIPTGEGANIMAERASQLTYEPRTETGQEMVSDIGEALSVLPPVLGTPLGGLKTLGTLSKAKITGSTKKLLDDVNKKLSDGVVERESKLIKSAEKQGVTDGIAPLMIHSSKIDKIKMMEMMNKRQGAMSDPKLKATLRPSDVPAQTFMKQIEFAKNSHVRAGTTLDRVASRGRDSKINATTYTDNIKSQLNEMGVTVDARGTPNFKGSQIDGDHADMKLIVNILKKTSANKNPPSFVVHDIRKLADKNIAKGSSLATGTRTLLQKLSNDTTDSLVSKMPEYKKANDNFNETKHSLDLVNNGLGKNIDFLYQGAGKETGAILRDKMSTMKGRSDMFYAIEAIGDVNKKYGSHAEGDTLTQSLFADELDKSFTPGKAKGRAFEFGVEDAIDIKLTGGMGTAGKVAKGAMHTARGINVDNKIKALKNILRYVPSK